MKHQEGQKLVAGPALNARGPFYGMPLNLMKHGKSNSGYPTRPAYRLSVLSL